MTVGLKESIKMARLAKEREITDIIVQRKDLTYEAIAKMYGVSEWTIKQLAIKYRLQGLRKPGRRSKQILATTAPVTNQEQ